MTSSLQLRCSYLVLVACLCSFRNQNGALAELPSGVPQPLGTCVVPGDGYGIVQPNPIDPWDTVTGDAVLPPFVKYVHTRGIILAAMGDISDAFFNKVVATLNQMIPNKLDETEQVKMMDYMARKRTLIPIFFGRDGNENMSSREREQWEVIESTYSVCDVIFEIGPSKSQVMEVVEHLLHSINMVGLHFLRNDSWGISRSSVLHEQMQEAIDDKYYNVEDYEDCIEDEDELVQVELQEYSYLVIVTWMDLALDYGPDDLSNEWRLLTPSLLQEKQPTMFSLCEDELKDTLLAVPTNLEDYTHDVAASNGNVPAKSEASGDTATGDTPTEEEVEGETSGSALPPKNETLGITAGDNTAEDEGEGSPNDAPAEGGTPADDATADVIVEEDDSASSASYLVRKAAPLSVIVVALGLVF